MSGCIGPVRVRLVDRLAPALASPASFVPMITCMYSDS